MRTEGRTVKPGCQPLKMAKLRASTVGKMREIGALREAGATQGGPTGSEMMQGLYARSQTEPFVPDPVVDVRAGLDSLLTALFAHLSLNANESLWLFTIQGIVPKNNFGNIDLYVPSMLPNGAVHVQCECHWG